MTALCSAGGEQNLILLDRTTHKPNPAGTVGWAGSTFGPLHKSRVGEHEFEALMRTLDNLVGNRGTHESVSPSSACNQLIRAHQHLGVNVVFMYTFIWI